VATWLFVGAVLFGWIGVQRLRGRSFTRLPKMAGWGAAALAATCLVLALVLPPIIRPDLASARPSSSARLRFLSPRPGQVLRGNPAAVQVRLDLAGGRIVPFTSTKLRPNEGHVHLYLDGGLVSMTLSLGRTLIVAPGAHRLLAEFVAVDHAPFSPRVEAWVSFRVGA